MLSYEEMAMTQDLEKPKMIARLKVSGSEKVFNCTTGTDTVNSEIHRHEILSLKVPNVKFDFDVPDDILMLGFRH